MVTEYPATYLVFDLLVGLTPANLANVAADRTVTVASLTKTPTGQMVRDVNAEFPDLAPLQAELDGHTRAEHNRYLDAVSITFAPGAESSPVWSADGEQVFYRAWSAV